MISSASLTDLASPDLTGTGLSSNNLTWSSASLLVGSGGGGAQPGFTDPSVGSDSFQNIFAQLSDPSTSAESTTASSANYYSTNVPVASPTPSDRADGSSITPAQFLERSNNRSNSRSAVQRTARHEAIYQGSTAAPATGLDPTAGLASQPVAAPASPATTKNGLSSSGMPQNALPIAAANALGGLKSLTGAAFAMHITTAPSQGHAVQGSGAQATTGQGSSNQSTQDQDSQNQGNQNPAEPAASLSLLTSPAQTQPVVENLGIASLSSPASTAWTTADPPATLSGQPSSSPAPTNSTAASEVAFEDPIGAPQTVRTVQVQLTGEGEGRVDLRLVEHAGGLSVSVRATDSTLTKGLQENLPELSARLAAERYQTHTFLPPANEPSSGGSSSSSSEQQSPGQGEQQSSGRSFSQGGDSSQSGGQQGGQSGGQSSGDQPSDPGAAWWRQLAALGQLSSSSVSNSVAGAQPIATGELPANQ